MLEACKMVCLCMCVWMGVCVCGRVSGWVHEFVLVIAEHSLKRYIWVDFIHT